jgi:hypothetical protein
MPLTLGPRTIRDDRGALITGKSINELLGDARAEAGKRRFSWRMVVGFSVFTALFYLHLARVMFQSASRNGMGTWILAAVILAAGLAAAWILWRRVSGKKTNVFGDPNLSEVQSAAVAGALVAAHRCGACGYGLRAGGATGDGFVVCSECGAAWHASKMNEDAPTAQGVADRIDQTLKESGTSVNRPFDDRFMPVSIATHSGRADRASPASPAGTAIAKVLLARVTRQRLMTFALVAGCGGPALIVGWGLWSSLPETAVYFAVAGAALVLLSLCAFGISSQWTVRRAFFLKHRVCPQCLDELNGLPAFDGRMVCRTCGAAWMASALGDADRAKSVLANLSVPCEKCGCNRKGLANDAPCPACGLGGPYPPPHTTPHCAACGTALEGASRVCPRCLHQAGVEYR